jgi:hypothetical protein
MSGCEVGWACRRSFVQRRIARAARRLTPYRWAARPEFWSCRDFTIHKGGLAMKSNNVLIGLSILFFVLAAAFALVFWADVSLVAKIGFFVLGFGCGVTAGQWFARRSA